MLNCSHKVSEFKLQSCYCIHFQTNTLGKGMNPLSYGLNRITAVLLKGWIWHQITQEGWYAIKQKKPNKLKQCTIFMIWGATEIPTIFCTVKWTLASGNHSSIYLMSCHYYFFFLDKISYNLDLSNAVQDKKSILLWVENSIQNSIIQT